MRRSAPSIFPVGYRSRFRHPHPEVVARYAASGAALLRTDRDGAVTLLIAPDGATIRREREQIPPLLERPVMPRGARRRSTIRVRLRACKGKEPRCANARVQCLGPHGLHRMAYTEWGDAANPRVLICVHGLTRNGRDFDFLAQALADRYRVVCPDVVGRGRSDRLQGGGRLPPPALCSATW